MARLTPDDVYTAIAPAAGQTLIWDRKGTGDGEPLAGFALRITAGGSRAFVYSYRFAGQQFRFKIGTAKSEPRGKGWGLEEARREADGWRKQIDKGASHPLAERKGAREATKAAKEAETFQAAYEDYYRHEAIGRRQNATADAVKASILHHCSKWLDRPVASITPHDIGKLLRQVRDGDKDKRIAPRGYMANRLHAYLSAFFRWCSKPDVAKRPDNPTLGIDRPWDGEEVRDRWFSDKEIKAIWQAADAIGGVAGAYVKTLLLLGKRKTAWASARWVQIDDAWTWTPPVDRRRRKRIKRQHVIPLPALAQRILAPLKPKDGDPDASPFVFPGRKRGSHLYPGTDLQDDVIEKSGVADFFWHAIKHTMETRLGEFKVPPHIKDLILDHADKRGSGKGYDHYDYRNDIAAALEAWADHVERLTTPAGIRKLR